MPTSGTAKVFMHGRSQAIRLPKEFRMSGREVRVHRVGRGVLLEPIEVSVTDWFAKLDAYLDVPFLQDGASDHAAFAPVSSPFDE